MKSQQIFDSPFFAYDNSPLSKVCLDFLDLNKGQFSKVNIVHVHKPKKIYLLQSQRGPAVFQILKERYPEQRNQHINIQLKQSIDKNTNVILLENIIAKSSSILFLGFVGSKGPKPRSNDLSSAIRQFVYESKCNLAIVKQPEQQTGKVLFLFDGSDISFEGLNSAIVFSKKFRKELTVLHTFNSDLKKNTKHVKIQLKNYQQERKQKFQQLFQQKNLIASIEEKATSYDWIIMNRNGYRGSINKQRFIGSNTTKILQGIEMNMIILN